MSSTPRDKALHPLSASKPRRVPRRVPRRRMFWRIYGFGALMIVVIAVSLIIVSWTFQKHPPNHGAPRRLAKLLVSEFGENPEGSATLRKRLKTIQEAFDMDVAIYRRDGEMVASGGDSPPEPLSKGELDELMGDDPVIHRGFTARFTMASALNPKSKGSAYFIGSMRGPHPFLRLTMILGIILLVMAALSFPMARTIARPLEKVTTTARNLGRGDWKARANLERKDEVGVLADTIDDMADRIQRHIEAERELLANVSHEIRTPLARIQVALELCSEEETPGACDLKTYLEGIRDDVSELNDLVEDVLAITRLDLLAGRDEPSMLRLRRRSTTLQEVVQGAQARFESRHAPRELEVDLPKEPVEMNIDGSLVRRVVNNLLDNSVKYSEKDTAVEVSGAVKKGPEKPQDAPEALEAVVEMEVRDRGIGVEEDDLAKLFDPFYRTDKSRERATGGTGLGLTLCQRIVEAHGGKISAHKREGGGTVIRFWIPPTPSPKLPNAP